MDSRVPLDFSPPHLEVTREYYARYVSINEILSRAPEILGAFHKDASKSLGRGERKRRGAFTSDQLLRAILVMEIEQLSLRATIIRIDDSEFLRRFVGVHSGSVMDFTTLSKVYKAIRSPTWKRINECLGEYAVQEKQIESSSLRVDTTAYETNIHYPTDSSLLWDSYRVLGRVISEVREYDEGAVGTGRLQTKKVKRIAHLIARRASQKERNHEKLQRPYKALLRRVEGILEWSRQVRSRCQERLEAAAYELETAVVIQGLIARLESYDTVIAQVIDQAKRRVLYGEAVPNAEKIFSLFEPHTELLIRGKAGKPVEFGHMILLQQVTNKFITGYEVFRTRPSDASLVDGVLARHEKLFGRLPDGLAADKGFYESMARLRDLEGRIPNVSIAKKGSRNEAETIREHDPIFKSLQRYRAGIEGTISFLKRCFKLSRCLYRSFSTYASSVGSHVFAHNLVILARL